MGVIVKGGHRYGEGRRALVVGRHYYGELYECNPEKLSNADYIREVIINASKVGGFTLLSVNAWYISPGVSAIGIVLESHIAIHTWPEYKFATVDVYTCGDRADPLPAFRYIVEALEAKKYTLKYSSRNLEEP